MLSAKIECSKQYKIRYDPKLNIIKYCQKKLKCKEDLLKIII